VDGRFVTGQDPSAAKLATEVISILHKNLPETKSDKDQITEILTDYIEGTANGQPEKIAKSFSPQF
jgi:hypothetical protein